jgi:hypothetical protein
MTIPITKLSPRQPHSALTLTIVAWLLFVSSSTSCVASSVHQPRVSTCILNEACLSYCSAQLDSASWTLPTEHTDSHSIACTLPPSSQHIALCVAFFDEDHTANRMPSSAFIMDDRGPLPMAADISAASTTPSPSHALEIVHSGPIDGGFVWCLARQPTDDAPPTSAVVAVSAPPKLYATLVDHPATPKPTIPCNVNASNANALLLFTCDYPLAVVGALIAILCLVALVVIVMIALAIFRRSLVKVVTIGSTSHQSVVRVASWLGLTPTPDDGLFVLPFRMRFLRFSSVPTTMVLYSYVGRAMDANHALSELNAAIASNSESSRAICVVTSEASGSYELISRMREGKTPVFGVCNRDVQDGHNKVRREILSRLY